MSDHAHVEDTSQLPGSQDDPDALSTSFWLALMFIFMAVSAFFLHGLVYWVQVGWEREGLKAPGANNPVVLLKAEQADELERSLKADTLRLKSGLIINDGIVVKGIDPKTKTEKVFVKGLQYMSDKNLAKYTLSRAGKELKFDPSEVERVEPGTGRLMSMPLSQATAAFLKSQGS